MLVLTRKVNEAIIVRVDDVEIKIMPTDIRPDKVRLGVEAPSNVTINRQEVQERIDTDPQLTTDN